MGMLDMMADLQAALALFQDAEQRDGMIEKFTRPLNVMGSALADVQRRLELVEASQALLLALHHELHPDAMRRAVEQLAPHQAHLLLETDAHAS